MLLTSNATASRRTLVTAIAVATILFSAVSALAQSRVSAEAAQIDTTVFGNPHGAGGNANSLLNRNHGVSVDPVNRAAAGDVDPAFNPLLETAPGQVRVMAVQPDGKILAGGFFHTVNGVPYTNLVRLNADYSIDPTFSASVNAALMAIAVQADGKIVIGGFFTAVNGTGSTAVQTFVLTLLAPGSSVTWLTLGGLSPGFLSPQATAFTVGQAGSFVVQTIGYPSASLV